MFTRPPSTFIPSGNGYRAVSPSQFLSGDRAVKDTPPSAEKLALTFATMEKGVSITPMQYVRSHMATLPAIHIHLLWVWKLVCTLMVALLHFPPQHDEGTEHNNQHPLSRSHSTLYPIYADVCNYCYDVITFLRYDPADSTINYRVQGKAFFKPDLRRWPFDTQQLEIMIEDLEQTLHTNISFLMCHMYERKMGGFFIF